MSRYLNQLLALAVEAERRTLTASESCRLQTQLQAMDSYRRQAGGLQRGLLETRQERDYLVQALSVLTGGDPKEVELEARAHVQRQARSPRLTPQMPA